LDEIVNKLGNTGHYFIVPRASFVIHSSITVLAMWCMNVGLFALWDLKPSIFLLAGLRGGRPKQGHEPDTREGM